MDLLVLLNRIPFIVFFVFIALKLNAQQTAQYSNFITNSLYYNPSLVGFDDGAVLKTGHRAQWSGFEGSPKTTFASLSSVTNNNKINNPNYFRFGGYFQSEVIGPYKSSLINIAVSYDLEIQRNLFFGFGLFGGFKQFGVDATKINLNQPSDPIIRGSGKMFLFPDLSLGLSLKSKNWFIGLSAKQMFNSDWSKLIGSPSSVDQVHYHLLFGQRINKGKFYFQPNVLISKTKIGNPEININLNVGINDSFSSGLSVRNTNAIIALFGFKILNVINLYYSYDLTTSKLRNASINTHEIMLGIKTGMSKPFNSSQAKTNLFD